MKLSFALIQLLIFAFGSSCFALSSAERDYSSQLEGRLSKLIRLYDPDAEISVSAKAKSVSAHTNWPGMKQENQIDELVAKISDSDVRSVKIEIFSDKFEVTLEVKKQLAAFLGLSPTLLDITVSKIPLNSHSHLESRVEWQRTMLQGFQEATTQTRRLFELLDYSILALGLALFLGFVVHAFSLRQNFNSIQTSLLKKGIEDPPRPQSFNSNFNTDERKDESVSSRMTSGALAHVNLHSLPAKSWVALLSDCYWCEQDRYAAWLWLNMSHESRAQTLELWPPATRYVEFIATLIPDERSDHHHPYYIRPLPISLISQTDIQRLVEKSTHFWRFISPMRKHSIQLPISEIVALEKASLESTGHSDSLMLAEKQASELRVLPASWSKQDLTAEDELFLLSHADEVPFGSRELMPSWVWVALLPDPESKQLLTNYSASDLAGAWVGCNEVLSKIELLIPHQKMEMIKDYRTTMAGSWSSPVLADLTRHSCRRLEENSVPLAKAA